MGNLKLSNIGLSEYPEIAVEYAQYLKSITMKSELTVCEYMLDLRTFFRFLAAEDAGLDLEEIDPEEIVFSGITTERLAKVRTGDLVRFIYYLDRERDNHSAAKNRKISALRSFFKYLHVKKNLIDTNPAADLDGPKKKASLPKYLNLEESILLLKTVYGDTESQNRRRDFAIVTLFLNCGMRLSELIGINLTDISVDWQTIIVTGKGNKKREVFLNDACRQALYPYMKIRLQITPEKGSEKALFLSRSGRRISNKTVQAMIYKYLTMAGLGGRGLSVHKLRHTAATLMYQEGGVDVRVLQELLGHAQLSTTQIYTHVSNQNVKAAVEQNPLAGIRIEEERKDDGEDRP